MFIHALFVIFSLIFICTSPALSLSTIPAPPSITPFSIDLRNINLREALHLLAQSAHRTIVLHPAITGSITLHVQDSSPADLFDFLLKTHHLAAWHTGNIWYVSPLDNLIKQKQEESKWHDAVEEASPLTTQLWKIHYAKAEDIAQWLQNEHQSLLSKRGHIHVDTRTNILGVQDTSDRITALHVLIQKLDVPTQQVLIETRLVSIDSDYEQELGIHFSTLNHDWYGGSKTIDAFQKSNNALSVAVIPLADNSLLDIKLSALENEGHGELISSPRLFTTNLQTASIEAGEEIPYQETTLSGGTAIVFKKAVLSLKVMPHILPGRKVLLQLQINQDRPSTRMVLGVPAISTRQMTTQVLVPNGHTVVLGGIYESNQEKEEDQLPLLGKIPVLGWLFKVRDRRENKRELVVFVTPRIIE